MLAMSTDLEVPDDVNAVGLQIESNGSQVYTVVKQVVQEGNRRVVRFPATFAVRPPVDGSQAKMRARVVAYEAAGTPLVMRQAVTTIPGTHISLLRMPLLWANQIPGTTGATTVQSARGLKLAVSEPAPEGVTDCSGLDVPADATTTRINGKCESAVIDEATLPQCSTPDCSDLVPDTGNLDDATLGGERCFSAIECAPIDAQARERGIVYTIDPKAFDCDSNPTQCSLPKSALNVGGLALNESARLNFAVHIPAGRGQCRADRKDCYIPIAHASEAASRTAAIETWRYAVDGQSIIFPPVVKNVLALASGGFSLVRSIGCRTFDEGVELCSATTEGRYRFVPQLLPDADVDGGAGGKIGNLVMVASGPQMLGVRDGYVYAATNTGAIVRTDLPVDGCTPRATGLPTYPERTASSDPKRAYMMSVMPNSNGNPITAIAEMGAGATGKLFLRGDNDADYKTVALMDNPTGIAAASYYTFVTEGGKLYKIFDNDGMYEKSETDFVTVTTSVPSAISWAPSRQALLVAGESPTKIVLAHHDCGDGCFTLPIGEVLFNDRTQHRALAVGYFGGINYLAESSTSADGGAPVRKIWAMSSEGMITPIATVPDLSEPAVGEPPMQMPVDANCVWIFRGPANDRELACIRYRAPATEKPVQSFGKVGNAQGLAQDVANVYWGDRDDQTTGSVRCLSKPFPVSEAIASAAGEPAQMAFENDTLYVEQKGGGIMRVPASFGTRTLIQATQLRAPVPDDMDHYVITAGYATGPVVGLGNITKGVVYATTDIAPVTEGFLLLSPMDTGIRALAIVYYDQGSGNPAMLIGRSTGASYSEGLVSQTPMTPFEQPIDSTPVTAMVANGSQYYYGTSAGPTAKPQLRVRDSMADEVLDIDAALFENGDVIETIVNNYFGELLLTVRRTSTTARVMTVSQQGRGVAVQAVDLGQFNIPSASTMPPSQIAFDDECVYVVEDTRVVCLDRVSKVRHPIRAPGMVKPWSVYTNTDQRLPYVFVTDPGSSKVFAIERPYFEPQSFGGNVRQGARAVKKN